MTLPDPYRLLSVFCLIPLGPTLALEFAGLRVRGDAAPLSDHHRALLRRLADEGRIRWVSYGPDGSGYILTAAGELGLDAYAERYGPAHAPRRGPALGELIRQRRAQEAQGDG